MDVIDVTYALIRSKTAHIRIWRMLYIPFTFRVLSDWSRLICSLCSFCSSFCSQTEHLIQIYTLRFFIDVLISSIKQLYQSIGMDVIDVTYALIRLKTAHIRIWRMVCSPSRKTRIRNTPKKPYLHFSDVKKNRNSPKKPYCTFLTKNTPRQKYLNQQELLWKLGMWWFMMHSLHICCAFGLIRPRWYANCPSRFLPFRVSHLGCPTLRIFIV